MTIEQKKIEVTKLKNKISKLASYIKRNPPKTAKHALKMASNLFMLTVEYYKVRAMPISNYVKGGVEHKDGSAIVGEKGAELVIAQSDKKSKL